MSEGHIQVGRWVVSERSFREERSWAALQIATVNPLDPDSPHGQTFKTVCGWGLFHSSFDRSFETELEAWKEIARRERAKAAEDLAEAKRQGRRYLHSLHVMKKWAAAELGLKTHQVMSQLTKDEKQAFTTRSTRPRVRSRLLAS